MTEVASHPVTIGEKGRLVLPIDVRSRHGWEAGSQLVAIDTELGMLLVSVEDGLRWLRARWEGRDLVAELLGERRREVDAERGTEG